MSQLLQAQQGNTGDGHDLWSLPTQLTERALNSTAQIIVFCRTCGKPVPPRPGFKPGTTLQPLHCSDACMEREFPSPKQPKNDLTTEAPVLSWHARRELDWQNLIPPRQLAYNYDKLRPLAKHQIDKHNDFSGDNESIFITGASEAGKTYVAYRLARLAYMLGKSVIAMTAADIRAKWLKSPRWIDEDAKEVQVLLIDDLGMENASDGWRSELYTLLNRREERHLSTIVTTNRILDYFADHYATGTANRLRRMQQIEL